MQVQQNSTRVKAPATIDCPVVEASSDTTEHSDGVSLNPANGRDTPDGRNEKTSLLKCKKSIKISTMNVRTIRQKSRQIELVNNATKHNIEVIGIVDHKICHEDKIEYHQYDKYTLITTSAWRNASNSPVGGVGILVNKSVESALGSVQKWNDRILVAEFNGNPNTTIIVHYSPCEGSPDAEEHYNNLNSVVSSIPKHNVLLVVGDFNAHIGKTHRQYTYHDTTNKNGQLVIDFAEEADMIITNTNYKKKPGKLWTYISDMSGTRTQVDYILIRNKWKNSVKNCEAYNTFSSVGSDHRILTATLKLSLRVTKKQPRGNVYDWTALRNPDLQRAYTIAVRNRFEGLSVEGESVTDSYQHFIQANEEASSQLLPKRKPRKKSNKSSNPRIVKAREKVTTAFNTYALSPTADNHVTLQNEKQALQAEYTAAEELEVEETIQRIESANAQSEHGKSWKLINELTGRKNTKRGILKASSQEERIKKWHDHFQNLLGQEPVVTETGTSDIQTVFEELSIPITPFTKEEYEAVKKKLVDGKSTDPSGIVPEILKYCDLDDIILQYANSVLLHTKKPDQWCTNHLKPLPKSGDLSDVGNYRGITLSAIAAKITNKLILNRIQPVLDPKLRPNNNSFRPKRGPPSHILSLRRLIEGVKSHNLKVIITFVDFKKAFDSVRRERMFKILEAYGIPRQIIAAIRCLYENTKAKVMSPDGETDTFDILAGVLQGDTLAPFLFIIVLDYVMRQAINGYEEQLGFELDRRRSSRIPPIVITDLSFADDVALMSEETTQAQELLRRVEVEAAKIGLHLNAKKTELMAFNHIEEVIVKTLSGSIVKVVPNFKYLGSWMESSEKDFEIRKALGWSACHKMKQIWKSKLSRKMKIRIFKATVESILLYGCQTWTVNKTLQKRMDGCYTRMLRMVLDVSWKERRTNQDLYQDLPKLSEMVRERRMRLAGHCIRHEEEIAHQLVMWEPKRGQRSRGRRAVTYLDNLKEDTNLEDAAEIRSMMTNREEWRKLARSGRAGARPK